MGNKTIAVEKREAHLIDGQELRRRIEDEIDHPPFMAAILARNDMRRAYERVLAMLDEMGGAAEVNQQEREQFWEDEPKVDPTAELFSIFPPPDAWKCGLCGVVYPLSVMSCNCNRAKSYSTPYATATWMQIQGCPRPARDEVREAVNPRVRRFVEAQGRGERGVL